MKWHCNISLLFLSLLAFSGCENNIIDLHPQVGSGINSYAWMVNNYLTYSVEDSLKNSCSLTLQFVKDSASSLYIVNQSINGNYLSPLHLISTKDSMSISGLTPYSIV